jgi:hypothetical protein
MVGWPQGPEGMIISVSSGRCQSWSRKEGACNVRERVTGVLAWAQVTISRLYNAGQAGVVRLQHGQGLAEYALILALIAIVAIPRPDLSRR